MAASLGGQASATAANGTSLATPAFNVGSTDPVAGSTIAVAISWGEIPGTSLSSVTDNAGGNSYSVVSSTQVDNGGAATRIAIYAAHNINTTTAFVVTANFSASSNTPFIAAAEAMGVDVSPRDQSTGQSQSAPGEGTNAVTSGAVTTTTDGQFIFAATRSQGSISTISPGTNFTGIASVGGQFRTEYRIQPSAGSQAGTFTSNNGASTWLTSVATFKAAATGRTTKNTRAVPLGINLGMNRRMPV